MRSLNLNQWYMVEKHSSQARQRFCQRNMNMYSYL